MIQGDGWEEVACGLVHRGLCEVVSEESIYKVNNQPLLNGLFSVSKDEMKDDIPLARLIMNLKPWNMVSRCLTGDVGTLPSVTQLGSLHLHDDDVIVTSSKDLRCFFYLFRTPPAWTKFMAFGKEAPRCLVPPGEDSKRWFLAGRVLPMGYLNSVEIAQHIHRAVIQKAIGSVKGLGLTIQELRRDRCFSGFPNLFRVYLDNFDQLQKLDRKTAGLVAGTTSEVVDQVRECYELNGLPRHPKKTVQQSLDAEVQGAWLDGEEGTLYAKPPKVAKYVRLALELLGRGTASQRELQIVGGASYTFQCSIGLYFLAWTTSGVWLLKATLESPLPGFGCTVKSWLSWSGLLVCVLWVLWVFEWSRPAMHPQVGEELREVWGLLLMVRLPVWVRSGVISRKN